MDYYPFSFFYFVYMLVLLLYHLLQHIFSFYFDDQLFVVFFYYLFLYFFFLLLQANPYSLIKLKAHFPNFFFFCLYFQENLHFLEMGMFPLVYANHPFYLVPKLHFFFLQNVYKEKIGYFLQEKQSFFLGRVILLEISFLLVLNKNLCFLF